MSNLDPLADEAVRTAVEAFVAGEFVPSYRGVTVFETKNSRYRLLDGVVIAAPDDSLVGAELVGWLIESQPGGVVYTAWQSGARAVLVDRRRARNIVVTSTTRPLSGTRTNEPPRPRMGDRATSPRPQRPRCPRASRPSRTPRPARCPSPTAPAARPGFPRLPSRPSRAPRCGPPPGPISRPSASAQGTAPAAAAPLAAAPIAPAAASTRRPTTWRPLPPPRSLVTRRSLRPPRPPTQHMPPAVPYAVPRRGEPGAGRSPRRELEIAEDSDTGSDDPPRYDATQQARAARHGRGHPRPRAQGGRTPRTRRRSSSHDPGSNSVALRSRTPVTDEADDPVSRGALARRDDAPPADPPGAFRHTRGHLRVVCATLPNTAGGPRTRPSRLTPGTTLGDNFFGRGDAMAAPPYLLQQEAATQCPIAAKAAPPPPDPTGDAGRRFAPRRCCPRRPAAAALQRERREERARSADRKAHQRPLQDHLRDRARRDGQGLQGRAVAARAPLRPQGAEPEVRGRSGPRVPQALLPRGVHGGQAHARQHRHHLRLRSGRRGPLLHRDGVHRGAHAPSDHPRRGALRREADGAWSPGRSAARSARPTGSGSSTAISSRATSSSPIAPTSATWSRCSTSAWSKTSPARPKT